MTLSLLLSVPLSLKSIKNIFLKNQVIFKYVFIVLSVSFISNAYVLEYLGHVMAKGLKVGIYVRQ